MARNFGKMLCTLWSDEDFLTLSSDAKVLFSAFFSQPDITPAGVLPWTERRWRRWLHGDAERVQAAFDELVVKRYVVADEDTSEVLVRTFIKTDGRLTNGKLAASVITAVVQIRSEALAAVVEKEHPGVFPARRPIRFPSGSHPPSPYRPSSESRRDPDVTERNGTENALEVDGRSGQNPPVDEADVPRLEHAQVVRLLREAGAPQHLVQRPVAGESA